MLIYFEDYEKENKPFSKNILFNIARVTRLRSEYEHNKYIEDFEGKFAEYNNSKYVIAVNSGTTALELALRASGIKNGDEVILPAYTYIATALAVSNIGARPVFTDIKEDTLTINAEKIEKAITGKTKAIIAVHIHGNPCDMEKIMKIAKKWRLAVIEDASHAHGAKYKNVRVGNFGTGCFSCHSTKILSGIGNGGLITTNDKKTCEFIRKMLDVRNNPYPGLSKRTPCKINAIQAAILKSKLPYLDEILGKKRTMAANFIKHLPKALSFQKEEKDGTHVYRDFVILMGKRAGVINYLERNGIKTKIRYNPALHLTGYYKYLGYKKGCFPVTERILRKAACLPISFSLSDKEVAHIYKTLSKIKI